MAGKAGERPERPAEVDGTTHLFRALGKIIRTLRRNAGISQTELAALTHVSEDLISAIERGVRVPQPDFLIQIDPLLNAGGALTAASEDVRTAVSRARVRHPNWFQDFAKAEAEAVALHYYAPHAVPGLLQTQAYADAVFRHRRPLHDDTQIEKLLADRLSRQAIFEKQPLPTLSFVIEEAVLRRPMGGREAFREQLQRLLEVAQFRNVYLQIMPTERDGHPALDGQFTLITLLGQREAAYTENYGTSRLFVGLEEVRTYTERYGIMRAQALTPQESLEYLKQLLGEL
ncbi:MULTISPECIES: helix-turn-helix domain-containing protein [unclassified Streptomyces]|uniref:helix-turn-helix domain-containing protein n=1 Tax=unclassified Streptomyces TaxID=2593676 RepID=UPI001661446B|nr:MULTISPECIES: helix-turn-helix transcriptional regulator [unclassified Streptomyces]MBD0707191.1 transcriptional regulator [Streptomyces sp. CBMA291]MBD0713679.1 transcriptional regulator [Streptomyces sp. CBMA370]